MVTRTNRTYDSSLRARQAKRTRDAVIRAAFDLFSERGYARTTIPDIAARAGVSAETVQKIGPKRELLKAAALPSIFRVEEGGDLLDSDFVREALSHGTSVDLFTFVAGVYAEANRQFYGIWRAWAAAALDDADVGSEWQARMVAVRSGFTRSLPLLSSRGWLRDDVATDELASSFWLLTLPEVYDRLTNQAGMTHLQYVGWLGRALHETLLGQPITNNQTKAH